MASETCGWEVAETERLSKRIAPVVLKAADTSRVPSRLSELNWIFFNGYRTQKSFERAFAQLISSLETDIGWIREHTRYGELASTWEQNLGSAHNILRGDTLVAAETWLGLRPKGAPRPSELLVAFIKESRVKFDQEASEKQANIERTLVTQTQKARRPLAGAQFEVFEDESNSGYLRARIYLRPHFNWRAWTSECR